MSDQQAGEEQAKPFGHVYFVEAKRLELIKIGWTNRHPDQRLRALRTACPVPIETLGVIRAKHSLEGQLHGMFWSFRTIGEWFRADLEIRQYIARHAQPWPHLESHVILRGWYSLPDRLIREPANINPGQCDLCHDVIASDGQWYRFWSKGGFWMASCRPCISSGSKSIWCNFEVLKAPTGEDGTRWRFGDTPRGQFFSRSNRPCYPTPRPTPRLAADKDTPHDA